MGVGLAASGGDLKKLTVVIDTGEETENVTSCQSSDHTERSGEQVGRRCFAFQEK